MKPIFQRTADPTIGDCFSACLATLLDLELEAVPRFKELFKDATPMMVAVRAWLRERGFGLLSFHAHALIATTPGTLVLAGGRSKSFPGGYHCVVGSFDLNGNYFTVHDPNPHRLGLDGAPIQFYLLTLLR